jgi:NAD dependent epimerase/dehydratase
MQAPDGMSGARVCVTGADGFIGSHLCEALVAAGADVRAFVYYNSWNQIGWLGDLDPRVLSHIEMLSGDIRDAERVKECVRGREYVFHLSSLIAIPYSYDAPRSYVDVNVGGALNVLQACRESDALIRLLHVSTSEVYGSAQYVPMDECHPLVGQSPYSASKIGADKMAESYHCSFQLPVVIARPFNTFGPRQTARAVIPTIASQLLAGGPQLRIGALTPTHDFNYVTDTAAGMIALAECEAAEGQVVNIGTGLEWSIETLARMMMDITGRDLPILCDEGRLRPQGSEVNRLCADITKISTLASWRPRTAFRAGLESTLEWIGRNSRHFDPGRYAM